MVVQARPTIVSLDLGLREKTTTQDDAALDHNCTQAHAPKPDGGRYDHFRRPDHCEPRDQDARSDARRSTCAASS